MNMNKAALFSLTALFCSAFASKTPIELPRPMPKPGLHLSLYNKTDLTAVVTTDTCVEISAHSRKSTFMPMLVPDTDILEVIQSVQLRHDGEEATPMDCPYVKNANDAITPIFKHGLAYRMTIEYDDADNTCSFSLSSTPIVMPM